jgi:hypothetical protein
MLVSQKIIIQNHKEGLIKMNNEIESIWFQLKCNGFNQTGSFPTERTICYTVGELCMFPNNKSDLCESIEENDGCFTVFFKKHILSISSEIKPEILYKKDNGDSKKRNK